MIKQTSELTHLAAATVSNAMAQNNCYRETPYLVIDGVDAFQNTCHQLMVGLGWWTDIKTMQPFTIDQVNVPEKLCLIHSEISEAMEGYRKNLMDDKLPHRKMIEVELADAMIRIGDLAGWLGLDLAGAIVEKLAYNLERADHKIANRKAEGGKAF